MSIRLIKPLPQVGRVIPAGCVIDAPSGLEEKLVREGKAERLDAQSAGGVMLPADTLPTETEPEEIERPKRGRKGGVKKNA